MFVTNATFGICAIFYIMLALLGAVGFDRVDALVSLNWASYTGCGTGACALLTAFAIVEPSIPHSAGALAQRSTHALTVWFHGRL